MWILWASTVALGDGGPCAPSIDEYRHAITIRGPTAGWAVDSYRFAVPPASCDTIVLPRVLDGAVVEGDDLRVLRGELLRRNVWTTGDVIWVHRERRLGRGPFAAEVSVPPFPVGLMTVEIRAPRSGRLNVWASPHGRLAVETGRERVYRAVFPGGGRLVWSTERDWWSVGQRFERAVKLRLTTAYGVRPLVADPRSMGPEELFDRVVEAIELDPQRPRWWEADRATSVIARGTGSAAERAIVLISLLRAAGYRADPVLVRPATAAAVPMVVPSYALFSRIAVRVEREDGRELWFDPASTWVPPGVVPRDLRGATVLVPGDRPRIFQDRAVPDGDITVEATAVLADDGSMEIMGQVQFTDGAIQALREVLGPLPASRREQWIADLLRVVRPGLDGLRLQIYGVDDRHQPLVLAFSFEVPEALRSIEGGLAGQLPPVLAPQLARVLPGNLEVMERLTVQSGGSMRLYGVKPVDEAVDPRAIVTRSVSFTRGGAVLETTALRPWRVAEARTESEALLDAASLRGPELVLFPSLDRDILRGLHRGSLNAESKVFEALLWLEADELPEEVRLHEARRALRKAVRMGRVRTVADAVGRFSARGDLRGWALLWDELRTDHERLAVVEALEARHELREAWRRANLLVASPDPAVRVEALVIWARTQNPVRPPATEDPIGHKIWRDPALLLARAEKLAEEIHPGEGMLSVDIALAERLLARRTPQACAEAGRRIRRAVERRADPRALAVLEEWRACAGEPPGPHPLGELIARSRYDRLVLRSAVRTFSWREQTREARRWAMLAAFIERTDVLLWREASEAALRAGDLYSATYAMRRASDLAPEDTTTGVPLAFLATLLGDWKLTRLAKERVDYSITDVPAEIPIGFEKAESFILPEQRYAFLRHRDREVRADPQLLWERYDFHRRAGDVLGMRRDAAWLAREHRDAQAVVELYRAICTQVWSTHIQELFQAWIREPAVRRLRMETGLLTGSSDPMQDIPYLKGDAVAEILWEARYRPQELADRVVWPFDIEDPKVQIPSGYRTSRLLGALEGVVGFTDRSSGTVLVVSVRDELPPPLRGVFRLGQPVEEDGKITIYELDGGIAPAFVARRRFDGLTYWGAARTLPLARHAVKVGVAAQAIQ